MERDTNLHSPRKDEQLEHELRGTLQGNRPSRAEEWRDPEPPADDDPEPRLGEMQRTETTEPEESEDTGSAG